MKGDVAKAGDRAGIVPAFPWDMAHQYIGSYCAVISDPFMMHCLASRALPEGQRSVNAVRMYDNLEYFCYTADLVPIPPDEEATRLFAERSKPKQLEDA